MAYATAFDLTARYDERDIRQLISDHGSAMAGDLSANGAVSAALDDASGEIEAALFVGKRYSADALGAITGNSAAHLIRVTCDLAMRNLLARRPAQDPDRLEAFEKRAAGFLERLRKGENVFNLADESAADAGLPTVGGPSIVDYDRLGMIRDRTKHYYPQRFTPNNR